MATKKHGVVVIHGQGDDQYRGALLAEFANPIVELLRRAGNDVALEFDADAPVTTARIDVRHPGGWPNADRNDDHHVFELREGYWGDAFPAPDAEAVTLWALGGLGDHIDGIRTGWWRNPTAAPSEDQARLTAGRPTLRRVVRRVSPEGPRLLRILYRATLIAISALLMLLSVLTFLILRPLAWFLYALADTPGARMFGLTTRIADAIAGLNPFMSKTLGDAERFVTNGAWATNVRARIERILLSFLDDDLDDIIVVAYSAGAVVAYDVLLEGRPFPRRLRELAAAGAEPPPIRFITVGSGLYHLWTFARDDTSDDPERRRLFTGGIDPQISGAGGGARAFPFWTDLFARFDFVAAGSLREEITARSGLQEGEDYRSFRVVNYDHLVEDHGGYLRNKELAVPRVIAALFGSDRWMREGDGLPATPDGYTSLNPRLRATNVFWLNTAGLLPYIAVGLHALVVLVSGGYRAFCTTVSDLLVPGWAEALWAHIAEEIGVRPPYVVVGAILFAFFFVLGRALTSLWRPMVDDGLTLGPRRGLGSIGRIPPDMWRSVRRNAPGYAMLLLLLGLVAAAGLWFYVPARVRAGAFVLESGPHSLGVEIVDATEHEVALKGDHSDIAHPGVFGLEWKDGYGEVGEVLREYDDRVVRRFTPRTLAGAPPRAGPPPLGPARIDTPAFPGDPMSARGIPFDDVEFAAPLGPQRAWVTSGGGPTWVIVVHGRGATRQEGLRILPTLTNLGMTAMLITYRNDRESIQDPNGRYGYGATEWPDLQAAVDYALSHGARDVVLYGYSLGGAVTTSFLEHSDRASRVRAVVLDAPMLDFAPTMVLGIKPTPVVGAFAEPLRVITGWRLGIDWPALNYLDDDVKRLRAPILLLHGDADETVPVETSRTLARLRPDIVEYHEFPGVGHTRAWNFDPARYEAIVRDFLKARIAP